MESRSRDPAPCRASSRAGDVIAERSIDKVKHCPHGRERELGPTPDLTVDKSDGHVLGVPIR